MSEDGWRAFLAAPGVDDWVVLHGGATAAYRFASPLAAAQALVAAAALPALVGRGVVFTCCDTRLTIRLTRDVWQLEVEHIPLAQQLAAVVRRQGGQAERAAVQEVQLAIAAKPDAIDVHFWRAVLGYAPLAEDNAVDPLGHGSTVWMQSLPDAKPLRLAMHIDVSLPRELVHERLAQAIAAGGQVVDASHAPSHWTLADRAGNKVCLCAWPDGAALDRR